MFNIGPYKIEQPTLLAPMAGVTDLPFRKLCRQMGAGLVTSEMVTADPSLRHSRKSRLRLQFAGEPAPRAVQIAGADPQMLADSARFNVDQGAEIIDINMGCPAKKVCKKAAGSALLQDPYLVDKILNTVVSSVNVPVTLKIRTGWDTQNRNAVTIAKMAEDAGIAALAIHGRTRACRFKGEAEYQTIRHVVDSITIPVIANGDIDTPQKAASVLQQTGAEAVMIGRAAQGNPWIFREINHFLESDELMAPPSAEEIQRTLRHHLISLHRFYGEFMGLRIARKHIGWYLSAHHDDKNFSRQFNKIDSPERQLESLENYFHHMKNYQEQAA